MATWFSIATRSGAACRPLIRSRKAFGPFWGSVFSRPWVLLLCLGIVQAGAELGAGCADGPTQQASGRGGISTRFRGCVNPRDIFSRGISCCLGQASLLQMLLERSADVAQQNLWGETALHVAARAGQEERVCHSTLCSTGIGTSCFRESRGFAGDCASTQEQGIRIYLGAEGPCANSSTNGSLREREKERERERELQTCAVLPKLKPVDCVGALQELRLCIAEPLGDNPPSEPEKPAKTCRCACACEGRGEDSPRPSSLVERERERELQTGSLSTSCQTPQPRTEPTL